MTRALAALLLALLLAGCSSAPAPTPAPDEGPSVITDPTQGLNQTGAHIHDYWKGGDRLTIVGPDAPADEQGLGPGLASGRDVEVRAFLPSSGHVVPQGTAAVEVTFSWTEDALDSYTAPALYLKTAGTNASERIGNVSNGQALVVEAGEPDADLPHQLLSAWRFELRMSSPDPQPLRFKGTVSLVAVAVRGLPLPVFPPHPDPWNGASELHLLDAVGQLSYLADPGDGGCDGFSCPQVHRPASGAIVPGTAAHVAVDLVYTGQVPLQVWYHSATSRDFASAEPTTSEPGHATFEIPIGDGPDGPYAKQSQWEFTVLPATTGPFRTGWMSDYQLTASAVRA